MSLTIGDCFGRLKLNRRCIDDLVCNHEAVISLFRSCKNISTKLTNVSPLIELQLHRMGRAGVSALARFALLVVLLVTFLSGLIEWSRASCPIRTGPDATVV
jgi:hypothetical protein